jgi:hypothetical protein
MDAYDQTGAFWCKNRGMPILLASAHVRKSEHTIGKLVSHPKSISHPIGFATTPWCSQESGNADSTGQLDMFGNPNIQWASRLAMPNKSYCCCSLFVAYQCLPTTRSQWHGSCVSRGWGSAIKCPSHEGCTGERSLAVCT